MPRRAQCSCIVAIYSLAAFVQSQPVRVIMAGQNPESAAGRHFIILVTVCELRDADGARRGAARARACKNTNTSDLQLAT